MANVGGPMVEVKQTPKTGSHVWYQHFYYVNLCTRDHDNSSCTDLRQKADESGKYVRETVIFILSALLPSFVISSLFKLLSFSELLFPRLILSYVKN